MQKELETLHIEWPDLPKWPALLVYGKKITKEQAWEIILRTTNYYYLNGNDPIWNKKVYNILGLVADDIGYPTLESVRKIQEDFNVLNIEYLLNKRITSSYIGGPHGWCDWNGNIFCNSYNIGKWPYSKGIFEEWLEIAKAFPFLDLTSQLYSGEQCEDCEPVIKYRIKDGEVFVEEPDNNIPIVSMDIMEVINGINNKSGQGTTETNLLEAVEYMRNK